MFWENLGEALDASKWSDVRRFLDLFRYERDECSIQRIQLVAFLALHTQCDTKPKTFYANLKNREALAGVVLDATVELPIKAVSESLLSIFCFTERTDEAFVLHDIGAIKPFVSPYGPSVLQCGQSGCGAKFYEPKDLGGESIHLTIGRYYQVS